MKEICMNFFCANQGAVMSSDEIKRTAATDLSANAWAREICLQLALMNERSPAVIEKDIIPVRMKRSYNRKAA